MDLNAKAERSLITTYRKSIWNRFIGGIKDYHLIEPNDRIAVCISGGKDSILLAKCMQHLQKYSDFPFSLEFLSMDPGYRPGIDCRGCKRIAICCKFQFIFSKLIFSILLQMKSSLPAIFVPGCVAAISIKTHRRCIAIKLPWGTILTM